MSKKKIRYFIFGDTLPTDFPVSREISFDAASIAHFYRSFREDINGEVTACLFPEEGAVEFGYCVTVPIGSEAQIEAILDKQKYVRRRSNIAYGDGEFSGAYYFTLATPGNRKFPSDDTRKRIATWMTRFWPRQDIASYSYIEIPKR